MKAKLITLVSTVALTAISNGAIALSGTALTNVQGTTPATDLVAGKLGLLLIDTTGDGFLGGHTNGATLNPLAPKTDFLTAGSTLVVGGLFLGDYVAARLTTTVAFGNTVMSGALTGFDNTETFQGKNFAIVWFDTLTTAGPDPDLAGAYFGVARGADWTLPVANSGTFNFGTGATNLDQIALSNAGSGLASTAAANQGVAFATDGTTMQFIPEPSAAMLGALGALGLLRRRRN